MNSPVTVCNQAYLKIFFHAAKHPHRSVNGVLIGKLIDNTVVIEDAIPLLHHWTSLSPMMEIGLDLAGQYAESVKLQIVGYYQACERLHDTALAPVGERVAEKIRATFDKAIAFVINGETFGTGQPALIPYIPVGSSSWGPHPESGSAFSASSLFQLASPDIPSRALKLVQTDHIHQAFGDFDDHLEDVTIDWLRNAACLPVDV
ncbi:hypothetical protein M378DRAFT_108569 [Amanita muscaria Koide BX008]|uniref:MPN domain-containing protein n=1 Tax=Amanita muscaria (strain Koide BX008) TaxID=946122 RepID=A0A0C2X0P7_AMAMK|nr:hypothetical protein M378DRAFT_108569 [Amanita muscaria Koide BX008]